jgi:subtilase family serine protease
MNDKTAGSQLRRRAGVLAVVSAVTALTACSGSPSVHVRASTRSATYRADLAFAQCMRSHGAPDFPEPVPGESYSVNVPSTGPAGAKAGPYNACKQLLSSASATAPAATRPPAAAAADCLALRPPCYAPRQLRAAYGIQPLLDRGITGRGVTVVLPEEAQAGPEQPPIARGLPPKVTDIRQDIADFDSRFRLPPARIQVITTLAGSSASRWLAGPEEVGDTEMVHVVAPDAIIRVLLVSQAEVSTPARLAATFATYVRIAVRQHADVVSQTGIGQNFSVGEDSWTSAEIVTMNSALQYAASSRITVVAAAGDDGVLGNGSTTPVRQVILPASDPLVLAVGGTSLRANPVTGAYTSETAWSRSGGGFSHLFSRPAYQDGVPGIGATRGVPDVAGDASSTTSMAFAFTTPGGYELIGLGGTSAATPFWAGLIALADQDAGHPLGLVNPAIYRIARGPQYHKAFHDITTGSNTVVLNGATVTGYQAGPGWDPVTGWGTPDAQALIPMLAR